VIFGSWIGLSLDALQLHVEAQRVIGLRMMKLAQGGPAAQAEARRMVTEKTSAMAEAALTLAAGGSAAKVMRRYRTHVRANQRRLSRKPKK
jgi:hypothetical protein